MVRVGNVQDVDNFIFHICCKMMVFNFLMIKITKSHINVYAERPCNE